MANKETAQSQNVEEQMLSKQDLVDILKFAAQIYNTDPYGYFTPSLNNQNIIDLNNNPLVPTKEKVTKALTNYKNKSEELQAYSEFMESFDMLYKRLVKYYSNMLAFDLDISCINAYAPKTDYKSKEYKDDLVSSFAVSTIFSTINELDINYSTFGDINVSKSNDLVLSTVILPSVTMKKEDSLDPTKYNRINTSSYPNNN